MKTASLLCLVLLGAFSLNAQTNPPEQGAPDGQMQQPPPPGDHGPISVLTPDERDKVKAAHDKAIELDPTLDQKMKEAHQLMESARKEMHAAMIKADPSVEPILAKMMTHRGGKKNERSTSSPDSKQAGGAADAHRKGMANLSESERQQLMSLREQVKQDPSVVAAHEAVKNASTPDAREKAHAALRSAIDAAMIKADPGIEPILAKMHQEGAAQPSPSPLSQ
jgi:hypothetical protein